MDTCENYQEALSLSADGLLDEAGQQALEAHTAVCPDCAARLEAFAALRDAMAGWEEIPPDTLTPGILYKLDLESRQRVHPIRKKLIAMGSLAAVAVLIVALQGRLPAQIQQIRDMFPHGGATAPQPPADGNMFIMSDTRDQAMGGQAAPPATEGAMTESSMDAPAMDNGGAAFKAPEPPDDTLRVMPDADAVPPDAAMAATATPRTAERDLQTAPAEGADTTPMPPEPSPAVKRAVTHYVNTVVLSAAQVPEELAAFAQTDLGDRVEIVVTRSELAAVWPKLQEKGAAMTGEGIDDVSSSNGLAVSEPPMANDLPPAGTTPPQATVPPEAADVLIVVYKQ